MSEHADGFAGGGAHGPARTAPLTPLLESCTVLANDMLAPGVALLRLAAARIAGAVRPGQFVHLALPALEAHPLRRPLSVFCADAESGSIELVCQAVGEGTRHLLAAAPQTTIDCIGPVGRGWSPPPAARRVLLVGGGIGAAPLYLLARELTTRVAHDSRVASEVHLVLGAQSARALVCKEAFARLLAPDALHVTTDDGSEGVKGLTTEFADWLLAQQCFDYVATCGPAPMMAAIARLAAQNNVACEVSLERRMACGIGACLSCNVDMRDGVRRACVDGPVFDAQEVSW
ncbi:MAG: dihydroorotate dehydrogenase electron transfer subunit [Coriobacteriales bacterium]|jgi:dihydroorotate dehydrogenase electron transfer subunit|nr:dihydroorotate dehydrogenase electron transfer subunit [Coriobacteriales bacterium]